MNYDNEDMSGNKSSKEEASPHDCSGHGGSGVGGVFQSLSEMDFDRGPWNSALTGDYPGLKKYLEKGGEPNIRDSSGFTSLHYAAKQGFEYCTRVLLENGAIVDATTRSLKSTSLHRAAQSGYLDVCKVLLEYRADPCIKDADGKTALHKAVEGNHAEICKLLIESCPKCEGVADNSGKLPKDYVEDSLEHCEVYKALKWRRK